MKNTFKVLGIIAFVTIIGLAFASCGDAGDNGNSGGNVTNEKAVYTSVDDEGNKYELTITPQSDRAAYEPKAGDTYTLKIFYVDGTTKTSVGTVTQEVKNGSSVTATLSVSDISYTVTLITITDDVRVFTEIKGTIPITSGNDDDPPTIEIELTLTPQVEKENDSVIGVLLNKTALVLDVGGSEALVATVLPTNAANKNVTWSSSNEAVAQVSQSGLVSAVAAGSATITVTTEDGDKAAICNVTVNEVVIGDIAVTGVTLNKASTSILINGTEILAATVLPSNATNQNVTWSSSADSIATVSQDGLVTGKAEGIATITVKTEDGNKTATCAVTVTASAISVTGVTLNKTSVSLNVGASETLIATIVPSNATNQNVSWSSDKNAVATVTNGLVKALSAGSATITVKTDDGNFTATCAVSVTSGTGGNIAVTGVSLSKNTLSLIKGNTETLIATVLPANATNKAVDWESSAPSVATVTNGLVTAVSEGSATITVRTKDGGFPATCAVTVIPVPVISVTLNKTALEIGTGDIEYLTAIIDPTNATNQNVTWSSSNEDVATVLQLESITGKFPGLGVVTGKFPGSATITVTTEDGGKTATCDVTVYLTPAGLAAYLATLPANTATTPHNIPLRVRTEIESSYFRAALQGAPNKYVNLDLTGSTTTAIPQYAFNYVIFNPSGPCTTLCGITIPDNVTSIYSDAFGSCTSLTVINVGSGNNTFSSENGVLYNKNKTALIRYPEGKKDISFTVPDSVISIGNWAFTDCLNLASVTIGNGVTSIGLRAFWRCANLASVTFEANSKITSIADSTFYECTSLATVNIPNSITSIGEFAFRGCSSLATVNIPNSITSIGNYAFFECTSLASVTFTATSKVTSIGNRAFCECTSLASVTIPDSVTTIGSFAFADCSSLASVTFAEPSSVTSIGDYAFSSCSSLTNINIPNSVTSIGNSAFYQCSFTSVTFEANSKVTSIGDNAFQSCTSLTSINIPDSVTSIGIRAFQNCTSLTSVTFQGTIPSSRFSSTSSFPGDLRAKFYATDPDNGTLGTYITTAPTSTISIWTLQQ
jgi:uncharacterized protein YjdB